MAAFVLVHGAWVGEWCFDPIIPLLEAREHSVFTVSLTGFGKKRQLYSPDITILDHIRDVVDFVEGHDLQQIVLVGHSYGGGVVTGAWDQLRERVQAIFYLDASTPGDGDSHYDQMVRYDQRGQLEAALEKAIASGEGERPFPIEALRKRDPEKAAYMQDKVMPFPLGCMTTPIHFKLGPLPSDTPKTFVLCKKNISYHHQQAARIRADKSWRYDELDTHHDCMWEDPQGLVDILVDK